MVQLYIADLQAGDDRPGRERPGRERPVQALKGFEKIQLEVGESRQVSMELPASELEIFCAESNQWQLREGAYSVRLGSSSRDIRLEKSFSIESTGSTTNAPEENLWTAEHS